MFPGSHNNLSWMFCPSDDWWWRELIAHVQPRSNLGQMDQLREEYQHYSTGSRIPPVQYCPTNRSGIGDKFGGQFFGALFFLSQFYPHTSFVNHPSGQIIDFIVGESVSYLKTIMLHEITEDKTTINDVKSVSLQASKCFQEWCLPACIRRSF